MKADTLIVLLQIAGLLHLGLIAAGLLMPRAVKLRSHLAALPPFIRRLYWVYYSFIGLCLVGFGSLSFGLARALAARRPVAPRHLRLSRGLLDAAAHRGNLHF